MVYYKYTAVCCNALMIRSNVYAACMHITIRFITHAISRYCTVKTAIYLWSAHAMWLLHTYVLYYKSSTEHNNYLALIDGYILFSKLFSCKVGIDISEYSIAIEYIMKICTADLLGI